MANLKLVLNKPTVYSAAPDHLDGHPMLTFDEFLPYTNSLDVWRLNSRETQPRSSSILEAAKSMYEAHKKRTESSSFCFSLADDETLDESFQPPKVIEDIDLYTRYWPIKSCSNFFRSRNKMFVGLNAGYQSAPTVAYGGMAEWCYLLSGKMEIIALEPTKINLAKCSAWEEGQEEEFIGEENTSVSLTLKPATFMTIPAGWIVVRKAKKDSFALCGEYLHQLDFTGQLESFELDVIASNLETNLVRDSEIRTLYWLTAARLCDKEGRTTLLALDRKDVDFFRKTLAKWKYAQKSHPTAQLFAPAGMQLDWMMKEFRDMISAHGRKSLKGSTDGAGDVLMDKTPDENDAGRAGELNAV